ncbi:cell wall protein DAN4 [Takifugu rubripes]|uniref:cell wall protein DAN4 n=1 Tax=Takifugu rubripes TaxID=31033 RepID=UPI0005D1A87F|nr:prostate androgen-regulated mucin-like protein 1 [Takifugu rubripes]|eukprot:XP_011616756.1 PREDICTED: prostate androgen-regulated mucin-like protein 1 [Takifugu rubripes]
MKRVRQQTLVTCLLLCSAAIPVMTHASSPETTSILLTTLHKGRATPENNVRANSRATTTIPQNRASSSSMTSMLAKVSFDTPSSAVPPPATTQSISSTTNTPTTTFQNTSSKSNITAIKPSPPNSTTVETTTTNTTSLNNGSTTTISLNNGPTNTTSLNNGSTTTTSLLIGTTSSFLNSTNTTSPMTPITSTARGPKTTQLTTMGEGREKSEPLSSGSIAAICFMFIVVFILILSGLYTYKIRRVSYGRLWDDHGSFANFTNPIYDP